MHKFEVSYTEFLNGRSIPRRVTTFAEDRRSAWKKVLREICADLEMNYVLIQRIDVASFTAKRLE